MKPNSRIYLKSEINLVNSLMDFLFILLGLVKKVECMILQELENVKRQKEIVHAKLNLYDSLIAEYDQQLSLIKEQVSILEVFC